MRCMSPFDSAGNWDNDCLNLTTYIMVQLPAIIVTRLPGLTIISSARNSVAREKEDRAVWLSWECFSREKRRQLSSKPHRFNSRPNVGNKKNHIPPTGQASCFYSDLILGSLSESLEYPVFFTAFVYVINAVDCTTLPMEVTFQKCMYESLFFFNNKTNPSTSWGLNSLYVIGGLFPTPYLSLLQLTF